MKKVVITQSNYIPWIGYFDSIAQADEFIIFDCVQYTKRDWRNRNKILTPQGEKWLSVPVQVKGKYTQSIYETEVADSSWANNHYRNISQNYSKAPYFKELKPWLEDLYNAASREVLLSKINHLFISGICQYLEIQTTIKWHHEFAIVEGKNERLLDICKQANADVYFSGPAAKSYMDTTLFNQEGVEVVFFDFSKYEQHPQLYSGGSVYLSVLDRIFNTGKDTISQFGKCLP